MIHTFELSYSLYLKSSNFMQVFSVFRQLAISSNLPDGIQARIQHSSKDYPIVNLFYFNLHVDALKLLGKRNVESQEDCRRIQDILDKLLKPSGLSTSDMTVYRMDYCFNASVPDIKTRELLMHLFHKCNQSGGNLRVQKYKAPKASGNDSYFSNHRRSLQIYDKELERNDRSQPILPHEKNILRLEYQTRYPELKADQRLSFEQATQPSYAFQKLSRGASLFFYGDFYTIDAADKKLKASGLSASMCSKLHAYLVSVSRSSIANAARLTKPSPISETTARKYQRLLMELDICPVPIPKHFGRTTLINPFNSILKLLPPALPQKSALPAA